MKPSTPKTNLPSSTCVRKAVLGALQMPGCRIPVRFLTIGSLVVTLIVESSRGAVPEKGVQLTEVAVPKNVYSIAGEVRAFKAKASKGSKGQAEISVTKLLKQVGDFKTARAFAFDAKGRPAGISEVKVSRAGQITFNVTDGFQYLIYPDLNPRIRSTYEALCQLGKLKLSKVMVSKVCQEILCTDQPFLASDLGKHVDGFDEFGSSEKLGKETIGGFKRYGPGELPVPTGGGTICDNCMPEGFFYPADGCIDVQLSPKPAGVTPLCGSQNRLVYVREDPAGTGQIRLMNGDGSSDTGTGKQGFQPNVKATGDKIVFVREIDKTDKLFTMNTNGSEEAELPDSAGASSPGWGRDPSNPFIVFTAKVQGSSRTAIWRVAFGSTSGTRTQVTFPAVGETDDMAAVLDGEHLVFVRETPAIGGQVSKQLWIQGISGTDAPIKLTNIPSAAIREPVCGHIEGGRMVAFIVASAPARPNTIQVSRFNADKTALIGLHTIEPGLRPPLVAIDFSTDDKCLFFQAPADGPGFPTRDKHELFLISFDGSGLTRVTTNEVADGSPSVIPGSSP